MKKEKISNSDIQEEAELLIKKAWSYYLKEEKHEPTYSQVKNLAFDEIDNEKTPKFYVDNMDWTLSDVRKLKAIINGMNDKTILSFKYNDYEFKDGGSLGGRNLKKNDKVYVQGAELIPATYIKKTKNGHQVKINKSTEGYIKDDITEITSGVIPRFEDGGTVKGFKYTIGGL